MNSNIWKLSLPATPIDMDAENFEFGLCELVRSQYLQRLRQTVSQNLFALIEDCNVDSTIDNYIDVCVAEIEKEALRKCMVANLYREGMSRMINDVVLSTQNGLMHNSIKTVIVDANSELQGETIPGEATADVAPESSVASVSVEIPDAPNAFDFCDDKGIFELAVENFEFTGIRQGSNALGDVHPSTVRPDVINAVLLDPVSSNRVARTFEFRNKLKELPHDVRMSVDGRLDEFYRSDSTIPTPINPSMSLSEKEEEIIAYKRIAQLVVGRMQLHYDAGQISKDMFRVLCKLISKNLTVHTYDPSEETVAKTVDGFFSSNRYIGQFADINSYFIQ